MSDYKTRYSSLVTMRKVQAAVDKALDKLIKSGHTRKEAYGQGWQKVNLNEIVERFAPGSTPRPVGGKVEFYNPGWTHAEYLQVTHFLLKKKGES